MLLGLVDLEGLLLLDLLGLYDLGVVLLDGVLLLEGLYVLGLVLLDGEELLDLDGL